MGKKSKKGSSRRSTTNKKKTKNPSNKQKNVASRASTTKKIVEDEVVDKNEENTTETLDSSSPQIIDITASDIKALEYARKREEIERRVADDLEKRKVEKLAAAADDTPKEEDTAAVGKADKTLQAFKEFKKNEEEKQAAENAKVEAKIQKLAQEKLEQIQKSACAMTYGDESDDIDTEKIEGGIPKEISDDTPKKTNIEKIEDITTLKEVPKDMSSPESPAAEKQDCGCIIF